MTSMLAEATCLTPGELATTVDYIAGNQLADGAICWFANGHIDPWDHVEAAMGLSIGGAFEQAEAAYAWLRAQQRDDGGWYVRYRDGRVEDGSRSETNFVAYVATGVWHHYRISGHRAFLARCWPMVRSAIDFVLRLQAPTGEVYWALDHSSGVSEDALVTGCSSIYKSLECAISSAQVLGEPYHHWLQARGRLGEVLRLQPERFDRTWESKARFSMDWFYPVLTGVVQGDAARQRLAARWHEFVEPELGCRCVADRPWVTVAESCELALALLASGQRQQAAQLYNWLHQYRLEDGSYWTGYVFADRAIWPEECPTWTAAAMLLAADALAGLTPAHDLFTRDVLATGERTRSKAAQQPQRLEQGNFLEQP